MRGSALALVLATALACERKPEPQEQTQAQAELDAGALRASAIEGLEAAANDPVFASKLALAGALEHPDIEVALERLLARATADATLSAASDRFFAEVQEGPAMRAALAEFARANPELDLTALTEGFVAHVDERLTRTAIAERIEAVLRTELRNADAALARALLIEAGAAEVLGFAIVLSFADANVRAALEQRLGKDPAALQQRLERHLAEAGLLGIVAILDQETTAKQLAGALARALDDADVRERCEGLFGLALAEELDQVAFERELRALLDEPAVEREAGALLGAIAGDEAVRERVASWAKAVAKAPGFADRVLDAID
ncbi:MAG TPA: hypothetical protein VM869_09585 [Enhygromyxa sp.]|nr:hypothetical protein [Enhygromyxa sp.]